MHGMEISRLKDDILLSGAAIILILLKLEKSIICMMDLLPMQLMVISILVVMTPMLFICLVASSWQEQKISM